jgi:hypothetical protein
MKPRLVLYNRRPRPETQADGRRKTRALVLTYETGVWPWASMLW